MPVIAPFAQVVYALTISLILLVAVVLMLRHMQRAFFYPLPTALPASVDNGIEAALHRFEAALAEYAPNVLASLQPGLTEDQIAAIQREYGLPMPEELNALYRWRNGSPRDEQVELIPGHQFLPLNEAARARNDRRRQVSEAPIAQRMAFAIFAGHRTGWIPVIEDVAGDGYFFDPARRRTGGWFFYHFAEDRHYRFFPSLASFLAGAAECYETGVYRVRGRGHSSEDHARSMALWSRYASSPGQA